ISSDNYKSSKDDATVPEVSATTEYIQRHYDGYIKYDFKGEQLWEAFVDDFAEYSTPDHWLRGDKLITRAFRDMLRSRGVFIVKEKGANTISKHLAELVNSSDFPDWDKNDREYPRIAHLLYEPSLINMQQLRITEQEAEPLSSPIPQVSERAKEKAPMRQEQLRREPETSMPYSFSGQPVRHNNGPNRDRNKYWSDNINQIGSRPSGSQPYYENNLPVRH
ncbi:hypothetical protein K3495_g16922, partial [Podosphaera aphanis]